ncbi:hypothetical protein A2U01_0044471, partial [Trifolium medium]|nr:hypothetical protein [Trifolium medium]
MKKEKRQKGCESNPSSAKNPKIKGKKSKFTAGPRRTFTMYELYVENPVVPNVDPDVSASVNITMNSTSETPREVDTLGLEDPKSTVNLGKDDLGCSDNANVVDDGIEKANVGSVTETTQKIVVMTNAEASVPAKNVVPDTPEQAVTPEKEKSPDQVMTGNISDDNTVVLSQSD